MALNVEMGDSTGTHAASYDVNLTLFDPAGMPAAGVEQGRPAKLSVETFSSGLGVVLQSSGKNCKQLPCSQGHPCLFVVISMMYGHVRCAMQMARHCFEDALFPAPVASQLGSSFMFLLLKMG